MLNSPTFKLLKYDLKATSRLIIPITIISLVLGLISRILLGASAKQAIDSFNSNTSLMYMLTGLATMLVFFILIILSIVIFWVIVTNFWSSLFSDEGYLYHTLPVKPYQLLLSKLLCANIWQILMLFVIIIFTAGALTLIPKEEIMSFINNFSSFMTEIPYADAVKLVNMIIMYAILAFLSVNVQYLIIFMSMAAGQLVNEHKKLVSFGCYIGISIGIQTISQSLTAMFLITPNTQANTYNYYTDMLFYPQIILIIINLAICISLFMGISYIFKNKLNLE